ncbi:MAG: transcriptional regulator [Candidatus Kariarchaeaceae archaeon]
MLLPTINTVYAGEVFTDDFDDGDLEGWDLWGWNWTTPIIYAWEGSMINDNGILTSENPQNGMWSYACQESTVVYGTWSFDWLPSATNARDFVSFISEDSWDWVNSTQIKTAYGYYLWLNPGNAGVIQGIQLQKHSGTALDVNVGTYTALEGLEGWHSLDITRTINGQFKIFVDGELVIEETDTDITESTKFCFGLDGDSAFDNVRISDSIDIHLSGGSPNVFLYVIGLVSAGGIGFFLLKYLNPSFLHPIRLTITKLLYENVELSSIEIKEWLQLSWGNYSTHVKALKKKGYIHVKEAFHDATVKQIITLEQKGMDEFTALTNLLELFLGKVEGDDPYFKKHHNTYEWLSDKLLYPVD